MSNDRPEANVIFHLQRNQKIVFFIRTLWNMRCLQFVGLCWQQKLTNGKSWLILIANQRQNREILLLSVICTFIGWFFLLKIIMHGRSDLELSHSNKMEGYWAKSIFMFSKFSLTNVEKLIMEVYHYEVGSLHFKTGIIYEGVEICKITLQL